MHKLYNTWQIVLLKPLFKSLELCIHSISIFQKKKNDLVIRVLCILQRSTKNELMDEKYFFSFIYVGHLYRLILYDDKR